MHSFSRAYYLYLSSSHVTSCVVFSANFIFAPRSFSRVNRVVEKISRWGAEIKKWPGFQPQREGLPIHTHCPSPLATAVAHVDSPADKEFHRCDRPSALHKGVSATAFDDISLHPMLVAQIFSVMPENSFGPRCDWFADRDSAQARLFVTHEQDAFSFVWEPAFLSWIFPPFCHAQAAAEKMMADKARGTIVVPQIISEQTLSALKSRAHIVFEIPRQPNTSTPVPSKALPCAVFAFVIDGMGISQSGQQHFVLTLPEDVVTAFRQPKCELNADAWEAALARYPDRRMVTKVLRRIRYGVHLNYLGPRTEYRAAPTLPGFFNYRAKIEEALEKESESSWSSGPFRTDSGRPPLFNLICSPISGAPKRFSEKVRMVVDMSWPRDGSSVNELTLQGETKNVGICAVCSLIKALGKGTYLIVFDIKDAYKIVKVAMDDWHVQGSVLPDGHRFSTAQNFGGAQCGHNFNDFGGCYEFSIRHHCGADAVTRYVDDCVGYVDTKVPGVPDVARGVRVEAKIEEASDDLGVFIPLVKRKRGTRIEGLLGWTVDSILMEICTTDERRRLCVALLVEFSDLISATRSELQTLAGILQYLTQVLQWGKAFLGHLISIAYAGAPSDRVFLKSGVRSDLRW